MPQAIARFDLAALLLARDNDARRHVGDADGGVRRINVLAAGAGRAVGVDAAVALVDGDLDVVIDDRKHPDGREAGVSASVRVVGRDADKAVHAALRLQPAESVLAFDLRVRT